MGLRNVSIHSCEKVSAVGLAAVLVAAGACHRHDEDGAAARGSAQLREELITGARLPDGLGAARAVVLLQAADGATSRVFARDADADAPAPADELVHLVTLVAGLRTGAADPEVRFRCTGADCWSTHGSIDPAEALAVSCDAYFDDLARRLDGSAMSAAFVSLRLAAPPIPVDAASRVAFASRGVGWAMSPRAALQLARAMYEKPAPWFPLLDEGLVPTAGAAGPLRGLTTGTRTDRGWFVGYATGSSPRLVVVRVEDCAERCALAAVRMARFAIERDRPSPPAPGPTTPPQQLGRRGR